MYVDVNLFSLQKYVSIGHKSIPAEQRKEVNVFLFLLNFQICLFYDVNSHRAIHFFFKEDGQGSQNGQPEVVRACIVNPLPPILETFYFYRVVIQSWSLGLENEKKKVEGIFFLFCSISCPGVKPWVFTGGLEEYGRKYFRYICIQEL